MIFRDELYGEIELPAWLDHFIHLPEFVRLRGVRLSNIDSVQFKDFASPTRWEHSLGVAYLAYRCSNYKKMKLDDCANLTVAALLHDISTPPFAHSAESVIDGYSHELEAQNMIKLVLSEYYSYGTPVYKSQLPQFNNACKKVAKEYKIAIRPSRVAELIVGDGALGYLINGSLDLDNADNVVRAAYRMGFDVDRSVPLGVASWLATTEGIEIDLQDVNNEHVQKWLHYRDLVYTAFYEANDEELGRTALLHHLMRRFIEVNWSIQSFIYQTDESLLHRLRNIQDDRNYPFTISQLMEKYDLLENPTLLYRHVLDNKDALNVFSKPSALAWLERELSSKHIEIYAYLARKSLGAKQTLLTPEFGKLLLFTHTKEITHSQLNTWLREEIPIYCGKTLHNKLVEILQSKIHLWGQCRPWREEAPVPTAGVQQRLSEVDNWDFRLSRNESIHTYPSTFVHAIPASLIASLGLQGELILDPFGGTGQTAMEALKLGGSAISIDSNSIACLIAKTRFTYLDKTQRQVILSISLDEIEQYYDKSTPDIPDHDKWFHDGTYRELCAIYSMIQSYNDSNIKSYLLVAFSAILTSCTERSGKMHGYFADNTPLGISNEKPKYKNAIELFLKRVRWNMEITRREYNYFFDNQRDPIDVYKNITILKLDSRELDPDTDGIKGKVVAGVITSPPYLCMTDYTLGHRLSYYWLFPDLMKHDLIMEIGSRRERSAGSLAYEHYISSMEQFIAKIVNVLVNKGFLCMVVGQPSAKAFQAIDIVGEIVQLAQRYNYELIWRNDRNVHWHRNYNRTKMRKETILVFQLE